MKKLITVMVFAILGVATQSCADAGYDEVEQAVLEQRSSDTIDDEDLEQEESGEN
ncbi:MAG: hypothetical protein GY816_15625 [Cytophagales bacterium]|nr:hypothetical protein [Cytophagales bacterium]